ncbi:MAG TPA: hypothetical protein VGQ00_02030 [Candidatus Norongarragalinales archaeon]|jgi:hypothetical protein|nr:hypothetical protein [Candidatus Norongarragalinales archaeon]
MKRAQLFVTDVAIALIIAIVSVGVLTQALEANQRATIEQSDAADLHAFQIAQFLIQNSTTGFNSSFTPRGTWCVFHVPQQPGDSCQTPSNQAAFANCQTIRTARRLAPCSNTICLLEVRTCN